MKKGSPIYLSILTAITGLFLFGCANIIQKQSFDFKTTGLFTQPCEEREKIEKEQTSGEEKKKGLLAKLNPVSLLKTDNKERVKEIETTVNQCNTPDRAKMLERFLSIRETSDKGNDLGDSMSEVRARGFSIYMDKEGKVRRANTRPLYGSEALAAIGMAISPPPLQRPEDIKAYTEFINQHYGEEYDEKEIKRNVDRYCINTRNSLELGDDYKFVIVWRGEHVLKRVIKGGPVNNPKQDYAILLCVADFIGDTAKGAARSLIP